MTTVDQLKALYIKMGGRLVHVVVTIDGVEYDHKYNLNGLTLQA